MEREIRFRAYFENENNVIERVDEIRLNISESSYHFSSGRSDNFKLKSIVQYTGLHDKNGKEIYEGDLVQTILSDQNLFIGQVTFDPQSGYYLFFGKDFCEFNFKMFEYEVVGNIYEHQHLLNN